MTNPRIVQLGFGSPRPVLLVYHLNERNDAALKSAMGPRALIVNDTTVGSTYADTPPLASTLGALGAQIGVKLSPVIVAGFSAGGFATARILAQGGDPDALVVADGTYATAPAGWAEWKAYADRAKRRQRIFLASHTSLIVPSSTWHVLSAIADTTLPLGSSVAKRPPSAPVVVGSGPAVHRYGNFMVLSYPTDDAPGHERQGDVVLADMLAQAMTMLRPSERPDSSRNIGGIIVIGVVAALVAGISAGSSRR